MRYWFLDENGLLAATALTQPLHAADEPNAQRGAAVTVLKVSKFCFSASVGIRGLVMAREEIAVRPDRPGLKAADVVVEAGKTINSEVVSRRYCSIAPDCGTAT